ncbi:MAG: hypothetical protein A3J65_02030 [Candidatus Buchananbacteria bacterium RIFCSPHIGHO2_02_FULL_45_11b]|uniref:Toxin HicA n=4 Tax=Candidatus Buchananiibacteriota TaxID=1817903 RepID=A0A1G1Y144_9BACT|nr:MAG: hypothetical protein A2663_00400 [Candidatus Buchananbacteria bacterium RIFCSPHIGHO2_01_FULL_46_12]OGY51892.1 MAG: hypothetical protein A3J65_02030 [Candidatus Buchananbacteria bacterium RIFCSPHIGHO2_02_FULL_45_11b]OGY54176.1 MAG: hypothetical protein A3B15_01060 [Candidatus Buchananbacteria bacterium RIFCSPLOWO2_01_FULL_45_31]OGY57963.1 MAG: hypothetical protein A3H67_01725 [Candidatus Buchananbacteria bacterium RIFCSPLOWO2_02_FULL_46_11b]
MGHYANVKSKKFIRFLKALANKNPDLELSGGGRHPYKLACIHNGESIPIPSGHAEINKHIVKDIKDYLVEWGICSEEYFDNSV